MVIVIDVEEDRAMDDSGTKYDSIRLWDEVTLDDERRFMAKRRCDHSDASDVVVVKGVDRKGGEEIVPKGNGER